MKHLSAAMAICLVAAAAWTAWPGAGRAEGLVKTIKRVKPSIVAVGTYQALRRPPAQLLGSGFVVADGHHVVTSAHVLPDRLDEERKETVAVFVPGPGEEVEVRTAVVEGLDRDHDVAVLRIAGEPLPSVTLGDDATVEEGQEIAFTGFPIGPVLGLHASTSRGIVSAITPISLPQLSPRQLDPRMIRQLREGYTVFQLDATAFPGNSGSPLYDTGSGAVYGIINSVFVKESRERALQEPSGISYATPIRHTRAVLETLGLGR